MEGGWGLAVGRRYGFGINRRAHRLPPSAKPERTFLPTRQPFVSPFSSYLPSQQLLHTHTIHANIQ